MTNRGVISKHEAASWITTFPFLFRSLLKISTLPARLAATWFHVVSDTLRCQYTVETIHTRAHTGSEYRDIGGKDGRMETKSRKRHSRKNCAASESEIIPETFEFFGSRLLVKIGHYNAICVTDQRAWNVSTGTVYRQGNKGVKFRVGYRRRSYWLRGSRI